MSSKRSKTDISYIPEDVLELIFKRLKHAADVFRFEAVCKLWKSVGRRARSQQQFAMKLSPMLYGTNDPTTADPIRTAQRWLVTMDRSTFSNGLQNLLSGSSNRLQPLQIKKAAVSRSPWDLNCVVIAVIYSYGNDPDRMMFCNLTEKTWRTYGNAGFFSDIIYYKKNFYVLNSKGEVFLCDFRLQPKVISLPSSAEFKKDRYLVESSGDLLQVIRHIKRGGFYKFEILKLDFSTEKWIPVTSLGDNSLCLSEDRCFSVSSKDFPEFKSNCIYFILLNKRALKTYDLKTKRYETILPLSKSRYSYLWFTPDVTLLLYPNGPPSYTNPNLSLKKGKNLFWLQY